MVSEVWCGVRTKAQAARRTPGRHLAPGRAFRDDPGQAAVSVAGCRSRRRRNRHPRPAVTQLPCGRALLAQATERPGRRTVAVGHRQAEELWRGAPDHHAFSHPRNKAVLEQPSRGLPPADATARETDAPVQVRWASAALPLGSRGHPEPLPSRATPRELSQPPNAPRSLLPRVAPGDVCLLNPEADRLRQRRLSLRRR